MSDSVLQKFLAEMPDLPEFIGMSEVGVHTRGGSHTAFKIKDRFKRLLGMRGDFPPFDGVRGTPVMEGLVPKFEHAAPIGDPAASADHSKAPVAATVS